MEVRFRAPRDSEMAANCGGTVPDGVCSHRRSALAARDFACWALCEACSRGTDRVCRAYVPCPRISRICATTAHEREHQARPSSASGRQRGPAGHAEGAADSSGQLAAARGRTALASFHTVLMRHQVEPGAVGIVLIQVDGGWDYTLAQSANSRAACVHPRQTRILVGLACARRFV